MYQEVCFNQGTEAGEGGVNAGHSLSPPSHFMLATGLTHISAPGQWHVYPRFLRAPQYSTFACCLIPVLTLVVLLVMLDDIDDISFSKRRYFLIVSWISISVYCIPTRDTHITRDKCMGIHISRGYTYHCDTVTRYMKYDFVGEKVRKWTFIFWINVFFITPRVRKKKKNLISRRDANLWRCSQRRE